MAHSSGLRRNLVDGNRLLVCGDKILAEPLAEIDVCLEDSNGDRASGREDNSSLNVFGVRTIKVVGVSTTTVATYGTLLGVVVGRHVVIGILENLEEIDFTTSSIPARAAKLAVTASLLSVLSCAVDLGIQGPDGAHVAVEVGAVLILGHAKFEEENLITTSKSVYKK